MGKRLLFITLAVALIHLIAGCATPRIIVLSDPLDAREHNDLGAAHEASGELDLAQRAYAEAADKDPTWDQPLINLGNVHAALGDWPSAAASYRRALRRGPDNPEAMNNLAYALVQTGDIAAALSWSGRSLDLDPGNPVFMSTRALALLESGESDQALQIVDQVLAGLPADSPMRPDILSLRERILHVGQMNATGAGT
jgi:Flp pilus assembly protein TadD